MEGIGGPGFPCPADLNGNHLEGWLSAAKEVKQRAFSYLLAWVVNPKFGRHLVADSPIALFASRGASPPFLFGGDCLSLFRPR